MAHFRSLVLRVRSNKYMSRTFPTWMELAQGWSETERCDLGRTIDMSMCFRASLSSTSSLVRRSRCHPIGATPAVAPPSHRKLFRIQSGLSSDISPLGGRSGRGLHVASSSSSAAAVGGFNNDDEGSSSNSLGEVLHPFRTDPTDVNHAGHAESEKANKSCTKGRPLTIFRASL